jgi:hypothetical protein
MIRDLALTERLRSMLAQITSLTVGGSLHWEKRAHSAHRYARWNDVLLILGPDVSLEDHKTPRYLHITTLLEPQWTEINSEDTELRNSLLALVYAVEAATANQPPTDPFEVTGELLRLLNS